MATDPLLRVADELYALLPSEFTAARKQRADAAKADGDKELAARVAKLRKPSVAAWVVNQLVRHHVDEVDQLLSLGDSLRRAQSELDAGALRALSKQRRQVTAAVTRQGRALAGDLGLKVTDPVATQVEDTLHAAMTDEGAAAAVRSGLLTDGLTPSGLGSLELGSVVADPAAIGQPSRPEPAAHKTPTLTVVPDNTQELEEAEAIAENTAEAAAKARKKLHKADRRAAKQEAWILQLQAELEEVQRRAAELDNTLDHATDELVLAEEQRENAAQRVRAAEDDEKSARARVESLRD